MPRDERRHRKVDAEGDVDPRQEDEEAARHRPAPRGEDPEELSRLVLDGEPAEGRRPAGGGPATGETRERDDGTRDRAGRLDRAPLRDRARDLEPASARGEDLTVPVLVAPIQLPSRIP